MLLAVCNSSNHEIQAYEAVFNFLKSDGIDCKVYHQDRCLDGEYLSVEFNESKNCLYSLKQLDEIIDLNQVQAIWYLKPSIPRRVFDSLDFKYANFINKQFYAVRESLRFVFTDQVWLNDPIKEQIAENKILQLKIASKVGLKIPPSIVTSDPNLIREFHQFHKRIITKPLSPTIIIDYVIYTNEVLIEQLQNDLNLALSPAIYQKLIEKDHELRITVVGSEIFAVKILSQEDPATSIDWRSKPLLNDFEVKMEKTEIPDSLKEKIKKFMTEIGLNYGCIDIIVTKENEFVFLEVNPNGQWYFVQLNTGLQIARSIANFFVSKLKS